MSATITIKSEPQSRYVTTKNRRNTPERLRIRKYDPKARKHVEFVEVR